MGLRFRRSVKVCKGLRLNFSKSGVSATFGGRGLSYTVGHNRRRINVGIPGTGLSYSTQFSTRPKEIKPAASKSSQASSAWKSLLDEPKGTSGSDWKKLLDTEV